MKILCDFVENNEHIKPLLFFDNKNKGFIKCDFHDFVLKIGYRITWITNFTIWEDDCNNIADDIEGCELNLWQVKKAYEMAYNKNNILICGANIGDSVVPPKKDISYGLYNIFYNNYMKLLKIYIEKEKISDNDIEIIEKELLYDFFSFWIIKYEINKGSIQFSKKEDLKTVVFNHYKDKKYWNNFVIYYKRKLIKEKLKLLVKKVIKRNE